MPGTRRRAALELVETIAVALVLALLVRAFVLESFLVIGYSMEPTLHNGERLFVNKLVYRIREPQRGDIVVFRYPFNPSRDFIKRVVAVAGETVEIREGRVFVDGRFLMEPYVQSQDFATHPAVLVPPGHVYVLGDNRRNSEDSRVFGPFPTRYVKGRAFLLYWPLSRLHLISVVSEPGPAQAAPAPAGL